MKVFISQSGPRSHHVATTLRTWLPSVIQSIKPWLSSKDLKGGRIWSAEIQKELQESTIGIICVTASNQEKPWIQFEAGACAAAVEDRHAIPYLIDLDKTDLKQPLANLQVYAADKSGTLALLQTINDTQENPLDADVLKGVFEKWWPDLESAIREAKALTEDHTPERGLDDKVDEVLELARKQALLSAELLPLRHALVHRDWKYPGFPEDAKSPRRIEYGGAVANYLSTSENVDSVEVDYETDGLVLIVNGLPIKIREDAMRRPPTEMGRELLKAFGHSLPPDGSLEGS